MFKRRTLGPAFERSPYERLAEWSRRNLLALAGAAIGFFVWVFLVQYGIGVLNTVAFGENEIGFDPDGPIAVAMKVVGGVMVGLTIITTQTK